MASPKIVRALFEEKLKSSAPHLLGQIHALDLERVNDDKYLMRILAHVENSVQDAVDMLWDILVWRGTVGANDINETNIRMNYINEGSIFPYGRDIDGCLLLVYKSKLYRKTKKDFDEMKKIIIYWLDRIEREENGKKISVFIDLDGVSSFDIQLCNFAITLIRKYYPYFFNYFIIFEMHWSLSPTFKMIRSLMPPRAASSIKFVTKNTLSKVVQVNHALKSWGGKDDYKFVFVPENRNNETQILEAKFDKEYSQGMVQVKPTNTIIFRGSDNKLTFCMLITVTNIHESAVFFELRVATPEMFCVNPHFGTLDVSMSKSVVIIVQNYFESLTLNDLAGEKLMIVAIKIPHSEVTREELYDIWQMSPEYKMQEYTFRRLLSEVEDSDTLIANSLTDLRIHNQTIQNQLHILKLYQVLTLIVVTFAAFVFCFQHIWS